MEIPVMKGTIQNIVKSYTVKRLLVKFIFFDLQLKAIENRNNIKGVVIIGISRDKHAEDIGQK